MNRGDVFGHFCRCGYMNNRIQNQTIVANRFELCFHEAVPIGTPRCIASLC